MRIEADNPLLFPIPITKGSTVSLSQQVDRHQFAVDSTHEESQQVSACAIVEPSQQPATCTILTPRQALRLPRNMERFGAVIFDCMYVLLFLVFEQVNASQGVPAFLSAQRSVPLLH